MDGVLCAVFISRDSTRRESKVAVPAAAIVSTIASDARRRIAASEKEGKHINVPGTWNQVRFLKAQTMQAGITDENQVGLILDPGLETEFALSIRPEDAHQLGELLIKQAAKATGSMPAAN